MGTDPRGKSQVRSQLGLAVIQCVLTAQGSPEMHGETETSMIPRTVGVALHLALVVGAGWLCFGGGIETVGEWFERDWQPGDYARRLLLFSFGVVLWLRLTFGMFWLLKRKFGWDELVGVLFACVVYQLGFVLLGATEYSSSRWANS